MINKEIEELRQEYMDVSIPEELDFVVRNALKTGAAENKKAKYRYKKLSTAAASFAVMVIALTVAVNSSPVFAEELSKTPIIGGIVKVLTLGEYTVKEDRFDADIKVPEIQGLENKDLENSINSKYLKENKALYEEFMAEMKELKRQDGGNIGAYSGYEVKTDNDGILSVCRWETRIAADSYTVQKFDTIDKKNQILLTLPSLFKDDSYIDIISKNITDQMWAQKSKSNGDKIYWLEDGVTMSEHVFKTIDKDQSFYINKNGKLVIAFEQFEVAPGYMGTPEFVIPTEVLSGILVSNEYIK